MASQVKIHVLPGGKMPQRQTDEAIGYDVCLRAIVSVKEMDVDNPKLRKTLFDFENPPADCEIRNFIEEREGELVYRLEPWESVLVGIGFITEMSFPDFYWIAPRSGLASRHGITISNTPGTVDPDYRGEAGAILVNQSQKSFYLKRNMRIAQIIFMKASIPEIKLIEKYSQLNNSERGAGGFGSTGLK